MNSCTTEPNITQLMEDPQLFGQWFRGESWVSWRVFLKALFDLPFEDAQENTFTRFTSTDYPPKEVTEAWLIVGRREGLLTQTNPFATSMSTADLLPPRSLPVS